MHRFKHRSEGHNPASSQESLARARAPSPSEAAGHPADASTKAEEHGVGVSTTTSMAQAAGEDNSSNEYGNDPSLTAGGIMTSTCFDIPGYRIERGLGTVYGMSVRSRGYLPAVGASLKTLAGGEIGAVTKLMYRTRNDAVARLVAECRRRGANAAVGLRFDTGFIPPDGMAQVCAYATAVCAVELPPPSSSFSPSSPNPAAPGPELTSPMAEIADENQGTSVGAAIRNARTLHLAEGRR